MAEFWVCATCRSINRPRASTCYHCRARRGAAPEIAPAAVPTPPAPDPTPTPRFAQPVAAPPAPPVTVPPPAPPVAAPPVVTPQAVGGSDGERLDPSRDDVARRLPVRRIAGAVVVVALAVVVLAGGAIALSRSRAAAAPDPRHVITGQIQLVQAPPSDPPRFASTGSDASCTGVGDFRDIRLGMPVTIESADGVLLGEGWLEDGTVDTESSGSRPMCTFRFHADVLPATSYRITPGDRYSIERTADVLEAAGWEVEITIRS